MAHPVEIMSAMETDLLVGIVENLAKGNIGTAAWQAAKLSERGAVSERLAELVITGTEQANIEFSKLLESESKRAANHTDELVEGSKYADNLNDNADEQLREIYLAWDRTAIGEMNQCGANLLISANHAYVDIINKTVAQTLAGEITGRQAIANASREWARSGLPALIDSAGREWTTEAYAQTIVRSNVRNVTTDIQEERTRQYGIDLVEVDSHLGARPGCEPWQSKVYSLSGTDPNYPAMSETSRGEVDGLFGINCSHSFAAYFPGSEKTYKPYNVKENDRAYQNSQKQRNIERAIRRAKREEATAIAAGDTEGAQAAHARVLRNQKKMRSFISETGRTRRRDREQIYT